MPEADVSLSPRSVTFTATRRTAGVTLAPRRVTDVGPGTGEGPLAGQFYLYDGSPLQLFDGSPFTFLP